jgi:hypothetical protein
MPAVVGALAGLVVFFVGAVLLERGAAGPPEKYQPAQIKDGKIVPGGFDDSSDGG